MDKEEPFYCDHMPSLDITLSERGNYLVRTFLLKVGMGRTQGGVGDVWFIKLLAEDEGVDLRFNQGGGGGAVVVFWGVVFRGRF